MSQAKRKQKTSKSERRSSNPVHLTAVQKVQLGHGQMDSYEPAEAKTAWRGVGEIRGALFNPTQAAFNRVNYPSMFGGGR